MYFTTVYDLHEWIKGHWISVDLFTAKDELLNYLMLRYSKLEWGTKETPDPLRKKVRSYTQFCRNTVRKKYGEIIMLIGTTSEGREDYIKVQIRDISRGN